MRLLVSMGTYHPTDARFQGGWSYYGAVLDEIDWATRTVLNRIEYEAPPEHIGGDASLMFMGAHLDGERLYVCTKTEVLRYKLPDWELEHVFSHPFFNDLHSVLRHGRELAVANTGRETVQYFDLDGEFLREVNLAQTPPEARFRTDFDYRCLRDTKPHEVHLNQLFDLDGALWVTRLEPSDAVRVEEPGDRIAIPCGNPHDGTRVDDGLYFTTTNGRIAVADPETRQIVREVDLARFYPEEDLIGWCRGLSVVGDTAFVGFTRLRDTRHEKLRFWRGRENGRRHPSRVVEVDLKRMELVETYAVEHEGAAIYSVIALPD